MVFLTMQIRLPHLKKILLFGLIPLLITFLFGFAFADELDQVTADLAKQQKQLASLEAQKNQLASDINSASFSLSQVSARLTDAEDQLSAIEKSLKNKENTLKEFEEDRNALIRELYKQGKFSSLEVFLGSDDLDTSTKNLFYYDENLKLLKDRITALNAEVEIFKDNKAAAKKLRDELASLRSQYASRLASSQGQYYSTNSQITETKISIKSLTARQEQLIIAKIGNSLATGGLAPTGDPNSQVGYNPGFSPAFAGFSFGAYTHRNGMSQYGARGRALNGQNATQILKAYYPTETLNKNYSIPSKIRVNGTNEYNQTFNCKEYDFNEYIKHLYEVPSSWPTAVLQAQAVAPRSYAIKYINNTSNRCNGKPYICPSQSCQVVKLEINASSWQQAVNNTAKWVLTGGIGNFQYSSTAGGYLNTSGWDTTSGSKGSWPANAYENIGGSPWFYKGWYKNLAGATCGRSHPWLTETQFADILNSWVVYTKGNSTDKSRVTTWDTNCWGGNPYSISQMKSRAAALGGAYTKVTGVAASYSNSGYTSSISLLTDKGTLIIDGQVFRDIFNLRSPGHLALKTPLYNIEKK